MVLQVRLITGRSLLQGVGKEAGKTSAKYKDSVGICEMNPDDLQSLGIKSGTSVIVKSSSGSVVVKAVTPSIPPPAKVAFIPYGPYASLLFESETGGSGMPTFKGINVEIEAAPDQKVLDISELAQTYFRR